jgi:hypothetical protein
MKLCDGQPLPATAMGIVIDIVIPSNVPSVAMGLDVTSGLKERDVSGEDHCDQENAQAAFVKVPIGNPGSISPVQLLPAVAKVPVAPAEQAPDDGSLEKLNVLFAVRAILNVPVRVSGSTEVRLDPDHRSAW